MGVHDLPAQVDQHLGVALGSFPLEDVVETRVLLERASVVLACRDARPQDLERMRAALLVMDEPEVDRDTFNQRARTSTWRSPTLAATA